MALASARTRSPKPRAVRLACAKKDQNLKHRMAAADSSRHNRPTVAGRVELMPEIAQRLSSLAGLTHVALRELQVWRLEIHVPRRLVPALPPSAAKVAEELQQ